MKETGIGIIGYGYWGPNLLRNFFMTEGCRVVMVADSRQARLDSLQKLYPSLITTTDPLALIHHPAVEAIVIATPVATHFAFAQAALQQGRHVLIEKPMTASVEEGKKLVELSLAKNLRLMVDHTFLYTGAVRKMKELVVSGETGRLNYYDSTRINLGIFQPDVNVVWDLAPHDISILYHLTAERPVAVSATGISHLKNGIENMAYVTLHFQSNMIAHFTCSWSSPVKIRRILLGGDKKMILFDDMDITEKIRVYDTGYTSASTDEEKRNLLVDYRTGDVHIPRLELNEALTGVAADFIHSIHSGKEPLSGWQIGLDVVKVLEAAQASLQQNGAAVRIHS
ncbi:MAG TPA: Gfo/Idh/MocA family oxidoreductase [Chitinophagaceae bacterium]|nr:Gfo/Idh/MocA family oxidoreductase [Chitinophagaceae bacterium]